MSKIGVGIVTFNRESELNRLYESLPLDSIDCLVIVNDGSKLNNSFNSATILDNEVNLGVGRSKNKAINFLISKKVDYIFLIEDDLYIKDKSVFRKYISVSKKTGIHHLNYALHGMLNVGVMGNANQKIDVLYDGENLISLYENCVGAFSFFTKECLENMSNFDDEYYNALEHVDHSFHLIKNGFHPPFWFFADIYESYKYIGDDGWTLKKSVISSNPKSNDYQDIARGYFFYKNGIDVFTIQKSSTSLVLSSLKYINSKYGGESKIELKNYFFIFIMNKILLKFKNYFFIYLNKIFKL